MPSFSDYSRQILRGGSTTGQHHTYDSQGIVKATWYDDPTSSVAYFYDFYHDDEPDKNTNLHPENSKTKIPVDIKFVIKKYQSLDKDQVDVHIVFKPSYQCNIPYYKERFIDPTSATFPVGLYCDIKDIDTGIWNRWLVVSTADIYTDFPTWAILPCGYKFQWIYDGKKCEMWGVERSQSSYNSGVWRDFKVESPENQTKALLPYNDISKYLYYNQRLLISADLPTPIAWKITKVESLSHKGNILFTFAQVLFDEHNDYIERDKDTDKLIGMWADYYKEGKKLLKITYIQYFISFK